MEFSNIKTALCAAAAVVASTFSALFGGFDTVLITLMIFMGVDYVTGLIVAGVFHRSAKSKNGSLDSNAGWRGLCKKGVTLLIVLVAARLDIILDISFIRDGVVTAYIVNEIISITENAVLMGIPVPKPLENALEALRKKEGDK